MLPLLETTLDAFGRARVGGESAERAEGDEPGRVLTVIDRPLATDPSSSTSAEG
jgi:hypothetical protein